MEVNRVDITDKASKLVEDLKIRHGGVIFHQSGGCCDGSAPMLLPKDDFYLDDSDIHIGNVAGVDFYMNQAQYEYWKHTHLTVDVTEGRGSSFSLEIPEGYRFKIDSRLFTDRERKHLNT
jgi:hypothetical protein